MLALLICMLVEQLWKSLDRVQNIRRWSTKIQIMNINQNIVDGSKYKEWIFNKYLEKGLRLTQVYVIFSKTSNRGLLKKIRPLCTTSAHSCPSLLFISLFELHHHHSNSKMLYCFSFSLMSAKRNFDSHLNHEYVK